MSAPASLSKNKSFQFLVGCFVLFFGFKLWQAGWFDILFREDTEGFESSAILPMLIAAAVSAVQMVGVIAILIVSNVLPLLKPVGLYLIKLKDAAVAKLPTKAQKVINKVDAPEIDVDKLIATLNSLDQRITELAGKVLDDGGEEE